MPLKLRRTLSMEDLQNASDDEMDVLLSPSQSPSKVGVGTFSEPTALSHNGTTQRERMFPFSLIADESSSTTSRPRPKPNAHPIIVPVEMPENDDFFLHGPQAPILKVDSGSVTSTTENGSRVHMNGGASISSSSKNTYQAIPIPRSKSVRFEEPDDEFNEEIGSGRGRINSVQTQVNQVTQKMKDNIGRLLEREQNLDALADLSDQLHYSGDIYRQSTQHLRRKLWWRQQKTRLVLTAVFIFCTVLLFVPLISRLLR